MDILKSQHSNSSKKASYEQEHVLSESIAIKPNYVKASGYDSICIIGILQRYFGKKISDNREQYE